MGLRLSKGIIKIFLFFILSFPFLFFAPPVKAQACGGLGYDGDCSSNPCPCPGGSAWCDSSNTCHYTCGTCPSVTPPPGSCVCNSYGDWSDCSGGFMTRECDNYSGTCNGATLYQIAYCSTPPPPSPTGGGGPTPTDSAPPPTPAVSCSISIPAAITVGAGSTSLVGVTIASETGGTIDQVEFSLPNTSFASFGGSASVTDVTRADGFSATLQGGAPGGPITLTAVAAMTTEGGVMCIDTASVTVTDVLGWWQVGSGDVHAGDAIGGVIKSLIPTGVPQRVLIKNNTAGFSGVASTASSTSAAIDLGTSGGQVSSPANWKATGSPFVGTTEGYSYNYFDRKIPDGCTPTALSGASIPASTFASGGATGGACGDYYWYKYNSAVSTSIDGDVDLANRKVIFFTKGAPTYIRGKINFNDGVGAFYLFSEGTISIGETVGDVAAALPTPDIEGILFSEGQITTGTIGSAGDRQLHIRGGVVGLGGVTLQRNLSNNSLYPAEYFEFGPDLILSWPTALSRRTLQWREVAP